MIEENQAAIKRLLTANIKAELPGVSNPAKLADMTMTFYSGLCIEQNAQSSPRRYQEEDRQLYAIPSGSEVGVPDSGTAPQRAVPLQNYCVAATAS